MGTNTNTGPRHGRQDEKRKSAVERGYVEVTDGEFVWDTSAKDDAPNLRGINFSAKPGTLTMVRQQAARAAATA